MSNAKDKNRCNVGLDMANVVKRLEIPIHFKSQVAQGSHLWSLFYLLFVNDIVRTVENLPKNMCCGLDAMRLQRDLSSIFSSLDTLYVISRAYFIIQTVVGYFSRKHQTD